MRSRLRLLVLRRRIGRRGASLLLFGALYLLYGYGLLVEPLISTVSFQILVDLWPVHTWAWLWIGTGCAAVASAFLPPGRDWLGFTLLYPIAMAWGLASFVSWWPREDNPRGWIGAAVWCVIGGLITKDAGWAEPGAPRKGGSGGER